MANVRPSAGEETERVLDLPLLEGGVKSDWPGTISHYMDVCRQTVANFIVNRLIFELCAGAVRKRGSLV